MTKEKNSKTLSFLLLRRGDLKYEEFQSSPLRLNLKKKLIVVICSGCLQLTGKTDLFVVRPLCEMPFVLNKSYTLKNLKKKCYL